MYQDWKLIVFGAVCEALHHVLFDRLQAAGMGFYCTTQPNLMRIVLHAGFVVVQSGVEVALTLGMLRTSPEGEDLGRLVASINRAEGVRLDVQDMVLETPGAQALQSAVALQGGSVVEHMAAASLQTQSQQLVQTVAVFHSGSNASQPRLSA